LLKAHGVALASPKSSQAALKKYITIKPLPLFRGDRSKYAIHSFMAVGHPDSDNHFAGFVFISTTSLAN